jgi:hypothetical protein
MKGTERSLRAQKTGDQRSPQVGMLGEGASDDDVGLRNQTKADATHKEFEIVSCR